MTRRDLAFVTGNANKAREAERLLGVAVSRLSVDLDEIQASSIEQIVTHKLRAARSLHDGPLFVEDVSLGLDDLSGFPGPYIKWLLESAGGAGLARIAGALPTRSATALCCVALWDSREELIFNGKTHGQILPEPRGSRQFGWDAWFLPDGFDRTYGEMEPDEKDSCSHRAKALEQLKRHLGLVG